jgi:hypothetical protein
VNRSVENRKRLISITEGNLRNHHLYISGHHDFFPDECYGQSNAKKGTGRKLTLVVEGLLRAVETDIARDGGNGHPRNFFRKRAWLGEFFETHGLQEGDVIAIERLNPFTYHIYPFRNGDAQNFCRVSLDQTQEIVDPGLAIRHSPRIGRNRFIAGQEGLFVRGDLA